MTLFVINNVMCILLNQPTKESKNPKPQLNQCTAFALLSCLLGERCKAWKSRSTVCSCGHLPAAVSWTGREVERSWMWGWGRAMGAHQALLSLGSSALETVEIEQAKFFYSSTLCHGGAPQRGTWVSLWALSEAGACPPLALPIHLAAWTALWLLLLHMIPWELLRSSSGHPESQEFSSV